MSGTGGLVVTKERDLAVRVDSADPNNIYIGAALIGTTTATAEWQIKKLVISGADVSVLHADGNTEFDNVWDNRAALSYS